MIEKLKLLFYPKNVLIKLFQLRWRGMLYEEGWFESACYYQSINRKKEPIPWWTYSFNDFFIPKLNNKLIVFEYGSGNSTIFLSKKVKEIFSVENNYNYFSSLQKTIVSENVSLIYRSDKHSYINSIKEINKRFDLIIIDGRFRVKCIYASVEFLKEDGVLILDDSQREYYKEGIDFLLKNQFKHIYFSGVSAGTYKKKYTSIFYKDNNWVGI